ncbi:hypothetical protein N9877_04745 [Flavobacteriaceae bacterium]|nr:hypothetical protein [Flavobacteriaceae bacterium]
MGSLSTIDQPLANGLAGAETIGNITSMKVGSVSLTTLVGNEVHGGVATADLKAALGLEPMLQQLQQLLLKPT